MDSNSRGELATNGLVLSSRRCNRAFEP